MERTNFKETAGVKLSSWPEIGSDGVLLTPYVPKGITGYDDDNNDDDFFEESIY